MRKNKMVRQILASALFVTSTFIFTTASTLNSNAVQQYSCAGLAGASKSSTPLSKDVAKINLNCIGTNTKVNLAQIRGPGIINVWGSWCTPCVKELPFFHKVFQTNKVALLGIDVGEKSTSSGLAFAREHGIAWLNLYDPKSSTKPIFGFGVPDTWFISASGATIYKHYGEYNSYKELAGDIKKYLGTSV